MKVKEIRTKTILFSSIGVFILFIILIFVNLISSYIFARRDLTTGGIYSLSKSSKEMIKKLDEIVIIKAYFSKNLPVEYANNRNYLRNLLSEYRIYSKGKIKFEFIDPSRDKETAEQTHAMGISPIRFTQIQKDKYEVKEGYMGMALIHSDRYEIMPYIKSTEGLEYDITSRIKKLTSETLKKIGLANGHGEGDIVRLDRLYKYLISQYDLEKVDIRQNAVPADVSALIFVGPRFEFSDQDQSVIEQFIMRGKSVGFLIDSFLVDKDEYRARENYLGLEKLFEHYGIKVLPGLILDTHCGRITAQTKNITFTISNIVEYLFHPIATDFKKDNSIVKNMDYIVLPYVSPIEITEKENLDTEVLIKSSPKSWCKERVFSADPFTKFYPREDDKKGPFNVAVAIKPKPDAKSKALFTTRVSTYIRNPLTESDKLGRIFFITTAQFIYDQPTFLMNILDWLSQDEELITIRAKGTASKPLWRTTSTVRLLFKYISVLFMPVVVILVGLARWRYRRRVMKNDRIVYG